MAQNGAQALFFAPSVSAEELEALNDCVQQHLGATLHHVRSHQECLEVLGFANEANETKESKDEVKSHAPVIPGIAGISPALLLIAKLGKRGGDLGLPLIHTIKSQAPWIFACVFSHTAAESAHHRQLAFEQGSNMVTNDLDSLAVVLRKIRNHTQQSDSHPSFLHNLFRRKSQIPADMFTCPYCGLSGLSGAGLWEHLPLYHINEKNISYKCDLCEHVVDNIQMHVHYAHCPPDRQVESHETQEIYAFSLVVCRNSAGKYLVVQEFSGQGFWLPGGRVDPGEDFIDAAVRETKEEAGIDIRLLGILRVEFTPKKRYCRMRVIFLAEPIDESQRPKSIPDFESAGSTWISFRELESVALRGNEPLNWTQYLENGGVVYPLDLVTREGAPCS